MATVCAVVETAPDQPDLTFDELVAACKGAGDDSEDPEQLVIHGQAPRNATMKILVELRSVCRALALAEAG